MKSSVGLHCSGRSFSNLIVTVLVLVALTCLILPALVASRNSSLRQACANNMKVIGIGLCTSEYTLHRFPAGTITNEQLPPESRLSWYPTIWPYMEGGSELLIDWQKAWNDPSNLTSLARLPNYDEESNEYYTIVDFQPKIFCCPGLDCHSKFGNLTLTTYVGPSGVGKESLVSPVTRPNDGIWGYSRSTKIDELCDGRDNTILLLETSVENGPWTAGGLPTVRPILESESPILGVNHQFGGLHAEITNAVFADGSVRSLDNDIEQSVLRALVTVCGSDH
jgi:hypothetical protein